MNLRTLRTRLGIAAALCALYAAALLLGPRVRGADLPPGEYTLPPGTRLIVPSTSTAPATAPATAPTSQPATRPATVPTTIPGPATRPIVVPPPAASLPKITRSLKGANRPLFLTIEELAAAGMPGGTVVSVYDFGDGSPIVKGGPQAHVYNNASVPAAGPFRASVTFCDKTGAAIARLPIDVTVPDDTRPVTMVDTWAQLKAAAAKPGQHVVSRAIAMPFKGDLAVGDDTYVDMNGTACDWQALGADGQIAQAPFFKGGKDSVVFGGIYGCAARAENPARPDTLGQANKPYVFKSYGGSAFLGGCLTEGIWYGLNANNRPDRVLVENCFTESPTAISGYFAWIEASNVVVNFCRVPNVTNEHVLRVGEGSHDVTVYGNRFSNVDRHTLNPYDTAKSTICIHAPHGDHVWVIDNTCGLGPPASPASTQPVYGGPMGIGPLGGLDGATKADAPNALLTDTIVWGNTIYSDSTAGLVIDHGTERALIANNWIVTKKTPAVLIQPIETTVWQIKVDSRTGSLASSSTPAQYIVQQARSYFRPATSDYRHVADVEITPDNVLKREDGGQFISVGAGATNITVPGR